MGCFHSRPKQEESVNGAELYPVTADKDSQPVAKKKVTTVVEVEHIPEVPKGVLPKSLKKKPAAERRGSDTVPLAEAPKTLNKNFGYGKSFSSKYALEEEVGRGHFGHTCIAKIKKGEQKGTSVAVKIIPKAKILAEEAPGESNPARSGSMSSQIAIEDVRREVKILKALTGHRNVVRYYDALEDNLNVYVVMELCEGGELLDRILARGGRYNESDAIVVVRQILSVVAWCHLQGVMHRDLKPENFLFLTKEEDSPLKAIDFGLSDYIHPDGKLDDIVGSAYYVAPEVLHRSYSFEADVWSVGVIAYILLCGSRPFWARTESGIFRSVLRASPNLVDPPWPSLSPEAKDFVRSLLAKDVRRRLTAAQALSHPWIQSEKFRPPLDLAAVKSIRAFSKLNSTKRRALKALFQTLSEDEQVYTRAQFEAMDHNRDKYVTVDDIRLALLSSATEAMKESRAQDFVQTLDPNEVGRLDYASFGAAVLNVHQLEHQSSWPERLRCAYEAFLPQQGRRRPGPDDGYPEAQMSLLEFGQLLNKPQQRRASARTPSDSS